MEDSLYIVMPAYNEEANIEEVVKEWHEVVTNAGPESKLVVVNDGSKDNTYQKLLELKEKYPLLAEYLSANKQRITEQVECYEGDLWHRFTREHNHTLYNVDKIIIPMTARDTIATFINDKGLYMDNANVWFITVKGASADLMKAITCIINSTIFTVLGKTIHHCNCIHCTS